MSVPEVSEAGISHLDMVMMIMTEAFDPAFGEAWTRAQCAGMIGLPGTILLLARVDGVPAGFALARTIVDEAELLLLAVRPTCRRRGLGQRLIDASLRAAARSGAERLHLEMRENNPAQALYTALGFQEVGRRRGYYQQAGGTRADALTLSRPICD